LDEVKAGQRAFGQMRTDESHFRLALPQDDQSFSHAGRCPHYFTVAAGAF
jgi:hypothetical protein